MTHYPIKYIYSVTKLPGKSFCSVVGCLHIGEANLNVTLTSDFISSNHGYYLMDGEQIVLECSYASAKQISWTINQKTLMQYSPITNSTGVESGFENKIVTHRYSANKHSLVLNVDKSTDEGSTVICIVRTSPFGPAETGQVELKNILGKNGLGPIGCY